VYVLVVVFAAAFILMGCAVLFAYYRTRHPGLLLLGFTYAFSGAFALFVAHWWPLPVGFALVWVYRLLGMEPPAPQVAGKTDAEPK
jgi:hypothetical protein